MIKIFSLNKTFYLINDKASYKKKKSSLLVLIESKKEMNLKYSELINDNNFTEIYFYNQDLKKLLSYFSSMFRILEAAGGLVKNKKGEWLFIFRNGKWDLPKGKLEKKEKIKDAAIREVEEECGVSGLVIIKELPTTFHIYSLEEKQILKPTYWFEMKSNHKSELIPQLAEGITEVKWISKKDLKQVLNNTYKSIKEVIKDI